MTESKDITIKRGDNIDIPVEFYDDNDELINLTGYTVWLTVRKTVPVTSVTDDSDAVIPKKLTEFSILGTAVFNLLPADTNKEPGNYLYEVQIMTPDGSIYSSETYNFIINPDLTRDDTGETT